MRVLFAIFLLAMLTSVHLTAQNKYWLELKDKSGSPYRIDQPEAYLSKKSINRRFRQGLSINTQDLPISPTYKARINRFNVSILYTSKWFNAVAISCDEITVKDLEKLDFVKSIQLIALNEKPKKARIKHATQGFESNLESYGLGGRQMNVLNGQFLHNQDFRGKGITVAVIDGGFIGLHNSPFFDSLNQNNQLLLSKDFVDGDHKVSHSSGHGTKVLSIMAANRPGVFVGGAPEADYVCIRTEDRKLEMRIEECNWIAGAEYADSMGVDIINTSLGYSSFNLPSMNYNYSDMDGQTSLVSRAADIAFSKGILVVTSAGNNGAFNDGHIDAPGDAKHILTVGASEFTGRIAPFSSYGPTSDGRQKPEIIAPGVNVSVASIFGEKVHTASGTSYAAPLVAGLAAALWSAFPDKTNQEIKDAIIKSANSYSDMDERAGAGLPDFEEAFKLLIKKN